MSVKFVVHFPFYVNEIKSERKMPENEMGVLKEGEEERGQNAF